MNDLLMEYNTQRSGLLLKEYGRNIQNLVNFVMQMEDREKRTQYAFTLVELMKQITAGKNENLETDQKYWDDLYIISNFELDVDAPFQKPDASMINKRPDNMHFQSNRIQYKHYGRNIELLILEAIKKEDPAEREAAVIYIGKLMKSFYSTWNKEVIDDSLILENINTISQGKLNIDIDRVKEDNLFEKLYKTKKRTPVGKPTNFHRGNNRNNKGPKRRRS